MASHIEGCFLVVISSAKCMHSLHLVCIHPHVANIIRSAFPVRAYGDMNGTVECLISLHIYLHTVYSVLLHTLLHL